MRNFYFSHNVFKSCLLLVHQNEYLWSKGLTNFTSHDNYYLVIITFFTDTLPLINIALTLSQMTKFRLS